MPGTPIDPVATAITKAKSTTKWAVGMCDNFVANMYGYTSSGYRTALVHWNSTPSNLKHAGDMNAPAGALMFWSGGDGHVAISLGNGSIVSTDIGGNGTVTTAPASAISDKWGKNYLGWAYPYFQGTQAASSLGVVGSTPVGTATQAIDGSSIAKDFTTAFTAPFQGFMNVLTWGAEALAGLFLIGAGVYIMVRMQ